MMHFKPYFLFIIFHCLKTFDDKEAEAHFLECSWSNLSVKSRVRRSGLKPQSSLRWIQKKDDSGNYIIPYTITGNTGDIQSIIQNAVKMIEQSTCIRFKKTSSQAEATDHIEFQVSNKECRAEIGRFSGKNIIMIGQPCHTVPKVLKLLCYKIGLDNEELRDDRDKYVTIHMENVLPADKSYFDIDAKNRFSAYQLPYDFSSIMQSPKDIFAKSKDLVTIEPKNGADKHFLKTMGHATKLSQKDIKLINQMYECDKNEKNDQINDGNGDGDLKDDQNDENADNDDGDNDANDGEGDEVGNDHNDDENEDDEADNGENESENGTGNGASKKRKRQDSDDDNGENENENDAENGDSNKRKRQQNNRNNIGRKRQKTGDYDANDDEQNDNDEGDDNEGGGDGDGDNEEDDDQGPSKRVSKKRAGSKYKLRDKNNDLSIDLDVDNNDHGVDVSIEKDDNEGVSRRSEDDGNSPMGRLINNELPEQTDYLPNSNNLGLGATSGLLPEPCVDKGPDCVQKYYLCKDGQYLGSFEEFCPLTCQACDFSDPENPVFYPYKIRWSALGCEDRDSNHCEQNIKNCFIDGYVEFMAENCAITCKQCPKYLRLYKNDDGRATGKISG